MENQELIVIEQLPIIKEQLKKVAEEIDKKVEKAKSLVCTEENKQAVKNTRTEMKKELEEFEKKRKTVKEKILAPYMQFEEVYKECISEKYKSADKDLKEKIDTIEVEQKKKLEDGAIEYFEEYKKTKNIDFITFENMNLKVGLSDNPTKLKKQITAFIDQKVDDLNLIETQQNKEEILIEYKKDLNVSRAIKEVMQRKEQLRQLEQEKMKQQVVHIEMNENHEITKQSHEELENIFNKETKEVQTNQKVYTITFSVTDTSVRLKQLKDYLIREGYQYE